MNKLTSDENFAKKRFEELASRCCLNGMYAFTEFLSPAEQAILKASVKDVPYYFDGGYENAEKVIAIFGSEDFCGYIFYPPLSFVKIEPESAKFCDKLSHRDFLGSIMSLGIRRSTFGDLLVKNNCAYVVCLENIAKYICDNLAAVKHTSVRCSIIEGIPKEIIPIPIESEFVIASERLDSIVSAIYKLSRSESRNLVEHEKVLVGGTFVINADYHPQKNDIITVRGYGKFIYSSLERETKKGRLCCKAKIYK